MLVDSHCHLDFPDFAEEGVSTIIARAGAAGVAHMLTICTRIAEFEARILPLAKTYSQLDCTVGTHPHQAEEEPEQAYSLQNLVDYANLPQVVGIGETGLDYYYDNAPRDIQDKCFRKHIRAANETGLPLIIHARDADEDIIRVLKEEGAQKGVMHCFSSTAWLAEQALALGFYISFSGIVTFKKAEDLREIAKFVPVDRILVETDSPYLAPVPMRGKRNEPSFVVHTAKLVAELKDMEVGAFIAQTTENFYTLFSKARRRA